MKRTSFVFEFIIDVAHEEELIQKLGSKIDSLKGVESLNWSIDGVRGKLAVNVCFENSDEAKVLHRRIVMVLLKEKQIEVTSASSMLTDIF